MKPVFGFLVFGILVHSITGHSVLQTTSGRVEGDDVQTTWGVVTVFFGIPYAEAPIGKNRFKVSQSITAPIQHPFGDATDTSDSNGHNGFGNVMVNTHVAPPPCPQFPAWGYPGNASTFETSEDCLKINVYVPGDFHPSSASGKLPILVFIPGSDFTEADSKMYDGSSLACKDRMIVVTVNYRVGKAKLINLLAL